MTATLTLDAFIAKGWDEHAKDAAGVWARLPGAVPLVTKADDLPGLAALVTHVSGEHLGKWDDGVRLLDQLAALPICKAGSAEAKAISRSQAALHLCSGNDAAMKRAFLAGSTGSEASDRIRVLAVAASALAGQNRTADAIARFDEALALAKTGSLTAKDPAARALAVTGNNLAAALEEKPTLTDLEKHLMLEAARTGRKYWEIAGTWREVERAEYRLAMSSLKAGLAKLAHEHAALCLKTIHENGGDPTELFFGYECEARVYNQTNDHAVARAARLAAADILEKIVDPSMKALCTEELAKLTALVGV